jgi:citrate lyase synthetase
MYQIVYFIFCLWMSTHAHLSYASAPLWTFKPLTQTTLSLAENHTAQIKYQITNESSQPHTLKMRPILGIVQSNIGSINVCANPFTLNAHESCTLIE